MTKTLVVLISLVLSACSGGDHDDLRQWMSDASKGIKGKVPELPQVKPYPVRMKRWLRELKLIP